MDTVGRDADIHFGSGVLLNEQKSRGEQGNAHGSSTQDSALSVQLSSGPDSTAMNIRQSFSCPRHQQSCFFDHSSSAYLSVPMGGSSRAAKVSNQRFSITLA